MSRILKTRPVPYVGWAMMILILAGALPALRAQVGLGKGRISGVVVDENGNAIEDAKIAIESAQSTVKFNEKTDKKGSFAVAGLGTGIWRISVSKTGFQTNFTDVNVKQLSRNQPVTITLKALTGVAAIKSDEGAIKILDDANKLLEEGKPEEALKIFEEFLAKHPDVYAIHLNIGACRLKMGDLEKAEAEYKLALDSVTQTQGDLSKDKVTTLRALSGLAEVSLKRNDIETAVKYFTQALDISPEDEIAAYNVGEVFFSNQKIDDAIKYYELAIKIKKDWPQPYLKLGYVYLNKGDNIKALENFNKFIQLDPDSAEAAQVKKIIPLIEKK